MPWAILWRSADSSHLVGTNQHPCRKVLFETRAEARRYADEHFGYIRARSDLLGPPHNWLPVKVVKVAISVEVVS